MYSQLEILRTYSAGATRAYVRHTHAPTRGPMPLVTDDPHLRSDATCEILHCRKESEICAGSSGGCECETLKPLAFGHEMQLGCCQAHLREETLALPIREARVALEDEDIDECHRASLRHCGQDAMFGSLNMHLGNHTVCR